MPLKWIWNGFPSIELNVSIKQQRLTEHLLSSLPRKIINIYKYSFTNMLKTQILLKSDLGKQFFSYTYSFNIYIHSVAKSLY